MSEGKAKAWCKNHDDMPLFETSAKEASNVEDAFRKIALRALEQQAEEDPIYLPETLDLNANANNATAQNVNCC